MKVTTVGKQRPIRVSFINGRLSCYNRTLELKVSIFFLCFLFAFVLCLFSKFPTHRTTLFTTLNSFALRQKQTCTVQHEAFEMESGVSGQLAKWTRPGVKGPWTDPATPFPSPSSNKNRPTSGYAASQLAVQTKSVASYIIN